MGSQGTPQLQIFLNSPILKMLLRLALPNMVAIITMESTKNELVPEWEDDLPADARELAAEPAPADD